MNTSILDTIFKRRSIRKYTDQPVTAETLTLLLKAGMAAPSARNTRPWEFIAVNDPAVMDDLRAIMEYGKYNAPAAIVVCGGNILATDDTARRYWVQDCSAATENILIAAAGMGLGTVWLGVYPNDDRVERVRRLFAIPPQVTPLCVLYVGYPAEEKEPRTQYDASRVHWQRY